MKKMRSVPACFLRRLGKLCGGAFVGLLIAIPGAWGVTCTSNATGNWNAPASWTGCAGGNGPVANTPGSADTATIANGHTITANVTITVGNVVINTGGQLNVAGSNFTVNGTTSVSGTINQTNTGGTVTMGGLVTINSGGTWASTVNEAVVFRGGITNNGIFNAGTAVQTFNTNAQSIGGSSAIAIPSLTVTGVTLTNNGTLTVATALSGTGGLTNGASGVLNIGGTSGITTLTATAVGNTVNYTGAAAQTIKATTYDILTASGAGAKTISAATTVNDTLTVTGTVTNNSTLTVTGALSGAGALTNGAGDVLNIGGSSGIATLTATATTNTVNYTGGAAQTIKATTYVNLTASGAGTKTISAPVTVNTTMTVTGTVTNDSTLTVTGALSGIGALTNGASGILNIGNTSGITTLTASAVGNTVNYTRAAAQTVKATTYHHLGLSGSGAKTLTGVSTVNGDLTLSGTATATTAAAFSIGGNLAIGAGTTFTSANFTNSVTGTTSVSGTLAHSGAAAKTYVGAVTINSAGVWTNAGNAPVTFRGGLTHNGATFTAGTGVYTFDTNAQSIGGSSAIAIPSLTVTGVTLTNNGTLTVATALSGTGGLTNGASGVLNIGGTSGITTLTATAVGNTVNYTGAAAQTIKATTYDILTASGAGAKTISAATTVNDTLTVTGTVTNNSTLTVTGALSGAGALTNSASGVLNIGGSSGITTLTATAVGNTVNYTGGAAQTIKVMTYHHLGISGGDKTQGGDMTANGVLTLTSGTLTTGANTLTLAASCPGSYSRTSGYVIGNLRLAFPGGNSTCIYHVGDSIGYAPITVAMLGATAGTLTGRADAGDHPDTISSSSGINAAKSANHYWTLTAGTLTTYTSYSATFQFCANTGSCVTPTELDTGANTANFIVARKNSGSWSTPTVGTKTSYSTQATGITSANGFGVFAVGEVNLCFADSFSGVLGGDWSVGTQSGGFTPAIVSGRLRLTDVGTSQTTWATLQRLFPAAGNKVTVEFDHFAYGGTGADGMAVAFSDASVAPVAGAFGGSLGYAQKSNPGSDCVIVGGCPGFAGGWLGVALDEYGNFSNPTEGRYGGTGQVVDSVSLRGSGSGMSGYRFLQGTATLSPGVDGNNVPPGTVAHRYRFIIDHTDSVHAYVSIERDTTSGTGTAYTTLIAPFDVKDPGYSQSDIPTSFNLSFTGSTGASTNIHEIGNLSVCTAQSLVVPTLHHIQIDHGGSACTSGTAPITVKACANAGCTALYMGSVTVDLTPNAGGALTWAPAEPVTFSGGSVAMTLANTTANTQTLGGTATSPTTGNATQCFNGATQTCSLVFSACTVDAVEVTAPVDTPIFTKLANTTFNLDVARRGGTPSVTAVQLVDASSGTCGTYAVLTATITPTSFNLNNTTPRQTVAFTYNNAAPNVRVRMTTTSPASVSCSSDNFAIRPLAFAVTSSATQSGSSGAPVFRAGTDPFSLTATAVYGATPTSGYNGIPLLNSSLIFTNLAHLGNVAAVTFPAASAGISVASGFKYDEVGNFNLAQYAVYDDAFAVVDSVNGECITGFSNTLDGNGKYSCQFGSAAAGPFGRFVPDHFTVVSTVDNACAAGAFTYMGQSFPLSPAEVLEARNFTNGVTANYTGAYAPGGVSFGAENLDNGIDLGGSLVFTGTGLPLSGTWGAGIFTLTGGATAVTYTRPLLPSGPFDQFNMGLTVTDADVATVPRVAGADFNPAAVGGAATYRSFAGSPLRMRFGRLWIDNAYGSELLALPVNVTAQYWSGSAYVLNPADDCTSIASGNFTQAPGIGATITTTIQGGGTLTGGSGKIKLTKPAPPPLGKGSVVLSVNPATLSYLPGSGLETFGVYKSKFIYIREMY